MGKMVMELHQGNCYDYLKEMAYNSVDAVIFDPPYNVGKDYGVYKDNLSDGAYTSVMLAVIGECLLVSDGNVGVYISGDLLPKYQYIFRMACGNNYPEPHIVVVHKRAAGICKDNWAHQYHACLFTGQPVKRTRDLWDDIRLPGEGYFFKEEHNGHPGLTSLTLTKRMIDTVTNPGDVVLDPFMGSGTTGIACLEMNRGFIGIEIDPGSYEIAKNRIESHTQLAFDPWATVG